MRQWKIKAVKLRRATTNLSENISQQSCYAQRVTEGASGPRTARQVDRISVGTSIYASMPG